MFNYVSTDKLYGFKYNLYYDEDNKVYALTLYISKNDKITLYGKNHEELKRKIDQITDLLNIALEDVKLHEKSTIPQ